jgi:hypothetical protein
MNENDGLDRKRVLRSEPISSHTCSRLWIVQPPVHAEEKKEGRGFRKKTILAVLTVFISSLFPTIYLVFITSDLSCSMGNLVVKSVGPLIARSCAGNMITVGNKYGWRVKKRAGCSHGGCHHEHPLASMIYLVAHFPYFGRQNPSTSIDWSHLSLGTYLYLLI